MALATSKSRDAARAEPRAEPVNETIELARTFGSRKADLFIRAWLGHKD